MVSGNRTNPPDSHRSSRRAPERENRPVATATRERTAQSQPRPKRGCPVATATEEREPSAWCCSRVPARGGGTHQRENRPVATATEVGPPSRNRDRRERTLRVLLLAAAAGDTHLGEAF